ncbi:MAG: GHKL domain-containing protein [Deltaproteobacteria bacterium]|nr:GHKL domain-containing protein [Deltaproteobacteria bacterium]
MDSPNRYRIFRRRIVLMMVLVTVIPLTIMAVINNYEYQKSIKSEIVNPMRSMVNKTKHSFEIFLEERLSIVRFIASSYSFQDLSDRKTFNRMFTVLMNEYCCFVDLGLIDVKGIQLSYSGPYALLGRDYSEQSWFQEVVVRGVYISDVFMGYREFPHIAIAVQRRTEDGRTWILRATLDTSRFINLIAAMGLGPESDAFLINRAGILQTPSRFYGKVLDRCPFSFPLGSYATQIVEKTDPQGREIVMAYAPFLKSDYALVLVKPRSVILKSWYTLKSEMFFIFIASVVVIILVVFKLTDILVKADEKRESAFRELEHSQKLSSIGRLAAGVAHEVNNPLAIINEKAGLINDLIQYQADIKEKTKFLGLTNSILQSVERCKTITHRLLGFARRMEVQLEVLDLNELIQEVLGFLEKEALYRNVDISLHLKDDLPKIDSDRGQLQQVFLNIMSNAISAMKDSGRITITSWEENLDSVAVSIQDTGCGMSPETLRHIFEPFFTTKEKGYGTGLGLPITYGIVKKMGGEIKVQSTEGKGTTFTIYLLKKPKTDAGK